MDQIVLREARVPLTHASEGALGSTGRNEYYVRSSALTIFILWCCRKIGEERDSSGFSIYGHLSQSF